MWWIGKIQIRVNGNVVKWISIKYILGNIESGENSYAPVYLFQMYSEIAWIL